MLTNELRKKLSDLGIEIVACGPYKDYWELTYRATFPAAAHKQDAYADPKPIRTTRYICKEFVGDEAVRFLVSKFVEDLQEYQNNITFLLSELSALTAKDK